MFMEQYYQEMYHDKKCVALLLSDSLADTNRPYVSDIAPLRPGCFSRWLSHSFRRCRKKTHWK